MKLLAPIAVIIAAASARQIYNTQSVESYANSAELYQSALEHQQRGLYSSQSGEHAGYEVANHRPAEEKHAKILVYHNENDGHHIYKYAYETENGIKAEEVGETLDKGTAAHGAYSYKGDDGQVYTITYTADENGFRPSGAHLPTPPPVPEEILKSLEQNAKEEAAGIFDDGKYHGHQDLGHQEHQHYEDHQSVAYHSSGHSGADLAFHAHAPSVHSGAKLVYEVPATHGSSLGHQESLSHGASLGQQSSSAHGAKSAHYVSVGHEGNSGHHVTISHGDHSTHHESMGHGTNLPSAIHVSSGHSYFTPTGHSGASIGHQESLSHGASLGHQESLGLEASLGHHASAAAAHGARSGHYVTISHEANSGHQLASTHGDHSAHQESISHGATLPSGFHVSSGHAISNLGYSAPTSFSMPSAHSGMSGHVGLSYLPPAGHAGSYHGHQ